MTSITRNGISLSGTSLSSLRSLATFLFNRNQEPRRRLDVVKRNVSRKSVPRRRVEARGGKVRGVCSRDDAEVRDDEHGVPRAGPDQAPHQPRKINHRRATDHSVSI